MKSLSTLIEPAVHKATGYENTACGDGCPFNRRDGECRLFGALKHIVVHESEDGVYKETVYLRTESCLELE